jgi:S-formylglutathione hydrolase FrmB
MMLAAAVLLLTSSPEVPPGQVLLHQSLQQSDGRLQHASVYLPHGYHDDESRRYPTLILLHGLGGDDEGWFAGGYLVDILDRAIYSGRIQPMIVVMPHGGNGYWANWVSDPSAKYSTLVEPVTRTWAENTFRTNGHVAIGGISMGGFGALSVALQHPKRFVAVLSFSGALFRKLPTGRSVYLGAFGYPGLTQARFTFINPIDLARHGRADDQNIWLDCGVDDSKKFTGGLREMSAVLTKRGVRHVAKFRSGRHSWDVWLEALEESLPWLNTAFERANKAAEPNSPSRVSRHAESLEPGASRRDSKHRLLDGLVRRPCTR